MPQELAAMRDVMAHRGPDGAGLMTNANVGLGHRRLSIIDLEGGKQPLSNEDGTVTVVFNGEIYNFADIRRDLQAKGHLFATRSDTEVIVHLYEEDGAACVNRLRGMFSFAIWDARKSELMLARDRLGIKPLYYTETGGSLVFASEIKGILRSRDVAAEIDPRGLRRYLAYRHSYGHGTMFKSIQQLPPGHVLVANASGASVHRYWDVPARATSVTPADVTSRFLGLLDEAVKLRMISDVPLGAFLSGGIDSSVITALMSRHADRVKTFSVGFVPGEESELGWAKQVAERCRAEHHEYELGAEDFFSLMQQLVWHHDEPMMFPASIPLYLLSRESKSEATVMLAGEGADEILAGYDTNVRAYRLHRFASKVPGAARRLAAGLRLPGRFGATASRAVLDDVQFITRTYNLSGHAGVTKACRLPMPIAADDDDDLIEEIGLGARSGTFLDRLLYFQLKTYLVALLMKQDKMSMAASIETRVPYLDHHLVELACSLPDSCKVNGTRGKALLKDASRGLLSDATIDRPKKGFPVPIAQWFRRAGNPFIEVLLDPESLRDGLLDADFVRGRVQQFMAGDAISIELWAMINLELWRREFLTGAIRMKAIAS
jgi:asparagine synthase (glutamine-hydrolysing)